MTTLDLIPVARNPLVIGRRLAPDAADPDVVVARNVPAPVAWNPLDILPGRLLVGGHLLNRRRRILGDNRCGQPDRGPPGTRMPHEPGRASRPGDPAKPLDRPPRRCSLGIGPVRDGRGAGGGSCPHVVAGPIPAAMARIRVIKTIGPRRARSKLSRCHHHYPP